MPLGVSNVPSAVEDELDDWVRENRIPPMAIAIRTKAIQAEGTMGLTDRQWRYTAIRSLRDGTQVLRECGAVVTWR
jgi:hypothetical protein